MQVLVDGGIALDVSVAGSGAHTVVLLAGFPLSREIWDATARELSAQCRVVLPDLRGTGASGVADGPYLMESLAGDLAAVLDALGEERATIVGHSAGGYVALAFARMFAERVRGLALVCSRLAADAPAQARERKTLAARVEREASADAVVDAYVARLLAPQTLQDAPEIVARVSAIARRTGPRGAAALLRGMAMRSASDDIAPELTMPVLVIAGARDAVVSLDEARSVAAAFPHAALVVAQRSGHLPMLEEPAFVTAALCAFIGRIAPASESGS
jgi:pimeloyl-ACP methyl ester carboxylesterase